MRDLAREHKNLKLGVCRVCEVKEKQSCGRRPINDSDLGARNLRLQACLQTIFREPQRNDHPKQSRDNQSLEYQIVAFENPTTSNSPSKKIEGVMSASTATAKASASPEKGAEVKDVKTAAALEEDDEFEDFPVDGTNPNLPSNRLPLSTCPQRLRLLVLTYSQWTDWAPEDSEVPPGSEGATTHLWEESWDDDDTSEDFSKQLK